VDEDGDGYVDVGVEPVIEIKTGDIRLGGHDLRVANDTHIISSGGHDRIESNRDGEFLFVFVLPANAVGTDDVSLILFFDLMYDPVTDLLAAIYDADLYGTMPDDAGKRDFEFAIQVPHLVEGEVDDDVYRNGDPVEIRLEYETPDTGMPPLSEGEEIEILTLLPDFSNVDSRFALGNSEDAGVPLTVLPPVDNDPAGRYDLTSWDPSNTDPNDLDMYDLALDVNRAINDGRLIIDANGGDYDVTYIISDTNLNSSGRKTLLVHAIDYPFVLDILDAPSIFTNAGLAFPGALNIEPWSTCATEACYDDDYGDILLDNRAPNMDFAILDPFVNTPLRKLDVNTGEYAYVFKEGDIMRVMIQIDPHDLTEEELNEVDPDEVSPTGNERGTVSNITIIGDISALLDPTRADLITDANRNGIPDDAEVYTVEYAGSNGEDDDFDGGIEDILDDDEDSTTNGINERFLYIISIEV
jgi:hypothetical protein